VHQVNTNSTQWDCFTEGMVNIIINIIIIIIFISQNKSTNKNQYSTGKPQNPGIIKADCLL